MSLLSPIRHLSICSYEPTSTPFDRLGHFRNSSLSAHSREPLCWTELSYFVFIFAPRFAFLFHLLRLKNSFRFLLFLLSSYQIQPFSPTFVRSWCFPHLRSGWFIAPRVCLPWGKYWFFVFPFVAFSRLRWFFRRFLAYYTNGYIRSRSR